MPNRKPRVKWPFCCQLSDDTQKRIKDIAEKGKKYDKKFSQGEVVIFALDRLFWIIDKEGFEYVFQMFEKHQ